MGSYAEAIAQVRARAEPQREAARQRLAAARPGEDAAALCAAVLERARVTLHFHPDRLLADGRSVAEGLLASGRYLSQFETGVSNGSLTAFAGGARDTWEAALFGGAYHAGAALRRPKYGALDVARHPDGGSPRFGSCYFVLRPEAMSRCTFTWGDSHLGPDVVGTADAFEPLLERLLDSPAPPSSGPGRVLDGYIEAQVHGELRLGEDVAALVVDPSFDGTPTGAVLGALCARHGMEVWAHAGFVLEPEAVPGDFRGPRMPALARRVASHARRADGAVDAAAIGAAAASLHREPAAWEDWGPRAEALQHLKQLWHVLVQFGRAA
jgi:hypothetical protein